jgi:hypothetical protein
MSIKRKHNKEAVIVEPLGDIKIAESRGKLGFHLQTQDFD